MPTSASTLKFFRQLHRLLGLFIAPSLLFFAFTGALQTFSLHETTAGSDYKPAAWIVTLAQVHKHQTDVVPVKKPKPAPDKPDKPDKPAKPADAAPALAAPVPALPAPAAPAAPKPAPRSPLPMKIFFLVVALGLFTSTLSGIYMAYRYGGSKTLVTALLLAGAVVPLVLLKL